MQDDHPYDMVKQNCFFYSIVIHTIQSLVQDQTKYYYGEKKDYISSEAFQAPIHYFSTPPERVQLGHIPRVTRDDR